MIEVFSNNVTVDANAVIPFNNISIKKGCTAVLSAPSTIQINKCGIYSVACDASVIASADGIASIQLYKNGIAQSQAQSSATCATGNNESLSFSTLVQVQENNGCSCCDAPTLLHIVNTGVEVEYANINVCVTKIC